MLITPSRDVSLFRSQYLDPEIFLAARHLIETGCHIFKDRIRLPVSSGLEPDRHLPLDAREINKSV
jgi:hypothetical protein